MTAAAPVLSTKCWQEHGLTITLGVIGAVTYAAGVAGYWIAPEWLETRDFLRNLGHGFAPLAAYNWMAGRLREVNKPEDPPDAKQDEETS
jgi:hypothetical protein